MTTMTSTNTDTVVRPCDQCRRAIRWTLDDLRYHRTRLASGQHAACACDDDCAATCAPWTTRRLARAIRAAEAHASL